MPVEVPGSMMRPPPSPFSPFFFCLIRFFPVVDRPPSVNAAGRSAEEVDTAGAVWGVVTGRFPASGKQSAAP